MLYTLACLSLFACCMTGYITYLEIVTSRKRSYLGIAAACMMTACIITLTLYTYTYGAQ